MIIDESETKHLAFLIILMIVLPTIGLAVFSHVYGLILIILSVPIGLAILSSKKNSSSAGSPTTRPMTEPTAEIAYGRVLTSEVTCSLCGHKNPSDALFCIKCGDYLDQSL